MSTFPVQTKPEPTHSSTEKYALLIGINQYQNAFGPEFPNLGGCVNDIEDLRDLLTESFGFSRENIVMLRDEQATRDGILAAIRAHVARGKPGDVSVFHYSGHGSTVDDDTRINGQDQCIIPHDGRDPEGAVLDITGSEIEEEFSRTVAENTVLIFDSCFSGSIGSRDSCESRAQARFVPSDPRQNRRPRMATRSVSPEGWKGPYIVVAASAQDEESGEDDLNGIRRGLFTFHFTQTLRASAQALTYRDLLDRLNAVLPMQKYPQHPGMTLIDLDRFVFGMESAPPRKAYFLVSPDPADLSSVILDAGDEFGMTVGSQFEVYPPGEKRFVQEDNLVANVKLTAVRSGSSSGRIVGGMQPLPGARACEITHVFPSPCLYALMSNCDAPLVANVQQKTAGRASLVISTTATITETWDIVIQGEGELFRVTRPGAPDAVRTIRDAPGADDDIADQLVHWAKWHNLLRITNPSNQLPVAFSARPLDSAGKPTDRYVEGGRVECTIDNQSDNSVYITILDFSDDGAVCVIYPGGSPPLLLAGQKFVRSFPIESFLKDRESVVDVLKLFASTVPRNFKLLEMNELPANREGFDDPLGDLFLQAAFGTGRALDLGIPLAGWTTLQQEVKQVRKPAQN